MDVNTFTGIGRLADRVEYTPANPAKGINARAVGRLVINRPRGKDGRRQPDYIRFVAWGPYADALPDYTDSGKEVAIQGPIQTNERVDARTGKKESFWEIRIMMVSF